MTTIGIHDIELATGHYVLHLDDLAAYNGVDPMKYHAGLGQDEMSVVAPDEDIVTMAASAAAALLARTGTAGIRTVFFATETGVDQSKAAATWVHKLLGLPQNVRVTELKQACYAGTVALQAALGIVSRNPAERVLVIASDIARYELDSPGEPTQGAGAVAMLIGANPALLEIEPHSGLFTAEVDDFWRPNGSNTAVVDGKLSVSAYLDALSGSWEDLQAAGGPAVSEIDRMIYHQPFTKMARKAQTRLREITGGTAQNDAALQTQEDALAAAASYNRRLGNTYTASLYSGLISLLDNDPADLTGKRLGLFSYGSGSVSELFTGIVQDGYRQVRDSSRVAKLLDEREKLSVARYRELHESVSYADCVTPKVTASPFRYVGTSDQARKYERV